MSHQRRSVYKGSIYFSYDYKIRRIKDQKADKQKPVVGYLHKQTNYLSRINSISASVVYFNINSVST